MTVVTELGHRHTLRNWGMRRREKESKVEVVQSTWEDSLASSNIVVIKTVVDSKC